MSRRWLLFATMMLMTRVVPAQARTIRVVIDKLTFLPTETHARVGDTIEWINWDVIAHTATVSKGDWDISIASKKNATLVLWKIGQVEYYCRFHPNLRARIIVDPR